MYSKVTYDKMSPALRDFVTFAYNVMFLFAMIFNLLVNRLKRNFCQVRIMC